MIWREKRLLLIVLGLLLVVNVIFFFTYRVQYETRLDDLDRRRDEAKTQLADATRERAAAEQQVAAYRKIEHDVQQVFVEHWATEAERLTRLITEVKRLAVAANLIPPSVSYARAEERRGSRQFGVGATQVTMSFSVAGTYQQIRHLINMLELSNHFVIIDRMDLSSKDGDRLSMNLQIKTLFRDTTSSAAPVTNRRL